MMTYAITAVHINKKTGHVVHVRWGKVDRTTNTWESPPAEADVGDVIHKVLYGEEVWTLFPNPQGTTLGPKMRYVVDASGVEGIETVDPEKNKGRTLYDMPRF